MFGHTWAAVLSSMKGSALHKSHLGVKDISMVLPSHAVEIPSDEDGRVISQPVLLQHSSYPAAQDVGLQQLDVWPVRAVLEVA